MLHVPVPALRIRNAAWVQVVSPTSASSRVPPRVAPPSTVSPGAASTLKVALNLVPSVFVRIRRLSPRMPTRTSTSSAGVWVRMASARRSAMLDRTASPAPIGTE